MSKHTLLFIPTTWHASGTMHDAAGKKLSVEGEAHITHHDSLWLNRGTMRLLGPEIVEFSNDYRIVPFAPGQPATTWTSEDSNLGFFRGTLTIVKDTMFSEAETDDGVWLIKENLTKVADDRYLCRGTLFYKGRRMSDWEVALIREDSRNSLTEVS